MAALSDDLWGERRYDTESSVARSCEEARVCVCPVIGFAFDPVGDQIPSTFLRSGVIQLGLCERILVPGQGRLWSKGDKKKQD